MHLEPKYSRSPVHVQGVDDMHLIIIHRVGGPSDSHLPRYFLGTGETRDEAVLQARRYARTRLRQDLDYHERPRERPRAAQAKSSRRTT